MKDEGDKPTPLRTDAVESLLSRLPPNWAPTTLFSKDAEAIEIRGDSIMSIAVSGLAPPSDGVLLMYERRVIAGFTVMRQQDAATRKPNEPNLNVDHYIVCETDHANVKYCRYGPYRKHEDMPTNAGISHWPTYEDFSTFVKGLQE